MSAFALIGNPKKRKVSVKREVTAKKRKANPVSAAQLSEAAKTIRRNKFKKVNGKRTSTVVRRKNPLNGDLKGLVIPVLGGAGAAVGVSMLTDQVIQRFGTSLPASLKAGWGRLALEAAVALGVGKLLEKTKIIKDANQRNAVIVGALTGVGISAIQQAVSRSTTSGTGAAVAGYQLIDVNALNGFQAASAPVPSLGYTGSAPNVGVLNNVRDFRRTKTTI